MKRVSYMAVTLALAYLVLSFNAYACLIPLYGGIQVTQGSDCAKPDEQQARQFCDAFKTLGVQTVSSFQPLPDAHAQGIAHDLISIPIPQALVSPHRYASASPPLSGLDILDLTSILRL